MHVLTRLEPVPALHHSCDLARVADVGDEVAGGTLWMELRYPWEASLDELLARVRKGPARG